MFISLIGVAALVSGSEPERGIRADRDFANPVSVDCINTALVETFGEIQRWDYVSDGRFFAEGTSVAQFAYFSLPKQEGWVDSGSRWRQFRFPFPAIRACAKINFTLPSPPCRHALREETGFTIT